MLNVVIAEDDVFARAGMKKMIDWSELNMRVVADASNGEEALAAYFMHKPQILLADLKMPRMDGLTLIRKIRQIDQEIQIIILTCHDDFALAREAIALGVKDYILKQETSPEEIMKILSRCADYAEQRQAASECCKEIDKEQLFNNFFFFESIAPSEFACYVDKKKLYLHEKDLCVCKMLVDDDEQWIASRQDTHGRQYRSLVTEIVNEVLHAEKSGEAYCDLERKYMLILCVCGQKVPPQVFRSRLLRSVAKKIYTYLGQNAEFVCSEFVNSYEELRKQARLVGVRGTSAGGRPVKAALGLRYIDENYIRNISLQDVAEYAGVTRNYMSRLLGEHFGCSFTELVNRRRVAKARELLSKTTLPIYEIADRVGFLSPTYFIRVFRLYCVQTPNSFRNQLPDVCSKEDGSAEEGRPCP